MSLNTATGAGEPLMTRETVDHIAEVVAAKGSDAFWQASSLVGLSLALCNFASLLRPTICV